MGEAATEVSFTSGSGMMKCTPTNSRVVLRPDIQKKSGNKVKPLEAVQHKALASAQVDTTEGEQGVDM